MGEFIKRHKIKILILAKTRLDGERVNQITQFLPYTKVVMIKIVGFIGGIWLLWNDDEIDVQVLNMSKQEIHAIVKVNLIAPD